MKSFRQILNATQSPQAKSGIRGWPTRSKYRNQPVEVDGHRFASKAEARRYAELKLIQHSGQIHDLQLQTRFPLKVNGELVCTYIADFTYRAWNGDLVVEDVKSPASKTPQYRMKAKLVRALLGIEIREVA